MAARVVTMLLVALAFGFGAKAWLVHLAADVTREQLTISKAAVDEAARLRTANATVRAALPTDSEFTKLRATAGAADALQLEINDLRQRLATEQRGISRSR